MLKIVVQKNGVSNDYLVRKIISNHIIFKWSLPESFSKKQNEVSYRLRSSPDINHPFRIHPVCNHPGTKIFRKNYQKVPKLFCAMEVC